MGIKGLFNKLLGRKGNPAQTYSRDRKIRAIQEKFYRNYPEIPYISRMDADRKKWLSSLDLFPDRVVDRSNMIRKSCGLLPGEIYMIHWLDKQKTVKKPPAYFEYEYGINFTQSLRLLEKKELVKGGKPTDLGKQLLEEYSYIIKDKQRKNLNLADLNKFSNDTPENFIVQMEGINAYKLKDYETAQTKLIQALNMGFVSPGGLDYLAKTFRKQKDYKGEIKYLEKGLAMLEKSDEFSGEFPALEKRLDKAKLLLEKQK